MEAVSMIFLFVAVAMGGFAWATAWSRRETAVRAVVFVGFVSLLPFLAIGALESLGWHKPSWGAHEADGTSVVLASKLVRGEGIYLYVDVGDGEPRSVVFPWDDETAQKLQDAMRESARNRQQGAIMEFDHSWDNNEPQFHPLPQPRLPMPKGQEPEAPRRLERAI